MNKLPPYDLLLDAAAGWRVLETEHAAVVDGRLSLQTLQSLLPALADLHGSFGGAALTQGVALWGDELFVADPERHRIWHWRPCCPEILMLQTIGGLGAEPRQLNTPLGLVIGWRGDLVVMDSGNRRLQLFTLPGLALRRVIGPFPARPGSLPEEPPAAEPPPVPCALPPALPTGDWWQPVDAARAPQRSLYVADRRGWVWKIDRHGQPDPHYDGRLEADCVPLRVASDRHGNAYLLCQADAASPAVVRILDRYGKLVPLPGELFDAVQNWLHTHIAELAQPNPRPATFDEEAAARLAILPAALSRQMDADVRQFLAQELARRTETLSLDELWAELRNHAYDVLLPQAYGKYLPGFLKQALGGAARRLSLDGDQLMLLPAHSEACPPAPIASGLMVDANGHIVLPDGAAGPYLIHHPPVATFWPGGYVRFEALDGGRVGNPWHRLALEFHIPERTGVSLFAFTSDVPRPDLKAVDPAGSVDLLADPPRLGAWLAAPLNGPEWLVQNPPGRYLYLTVALKGPGDRTPLVERLYVYARRQSSLNFLPAVYQSDPASRQLLDRLLSLYDTIWGEIETEAEDLPRLLDPRGAPPEFLPWLASWFDLALEQSWSVAQLRAFIGEAVELFRWRGVIRGLRRLLQLHTGLPEPMPRIVENYRGLANAGLQNWLGSPPQGDIPNHFTILLPAKAMVTPDQRRALTQLVDRFIPAHTHYTLRPVHPGLRLGSASLRSSALGLDSVIADPLTWRLAYQNENLFPAGENVLGVGSVLPSVPATPGSGIRLGFTRLGVSPTDKE